MSISSVTETVCKTVLTQTPRRPSRVSISLGFQTYYKILGANRSTCFLRRVYKSRCRD